MKRYVLDAWPLVQWQLKGIAGVPELPTLLREFQVGASELLMSRINYGEVLYSIEKYPSFTSSQKRSALIAVTHLGIDVVSATDSRVDEAVALKSRYAISYADAFAAGLAIELHVPLVTGDPEFRALAQSGLMLHWLGA